MAIGSSYFSRVNSSKTWKSSVKKAILVAMQTNKLHVYFFVMSSLD